MRFFRTYIVIGVLACSTFDARAQTQPPPAGAPAQTVVPDQAPAPLMVWNRTLAVFRAPYGDRDAQTRAALASARLESSLEGLIPDEIRYTVVQTDADRGAMILGGEGVLFVILEGDLPQGTAVSLETAGAQVVDRLQAVVRDRREQRRWPVLVRSTLEALLATVAFVAVWLGCRRALQLLLVRFTSFASERINRAATVGIDPSPFVLPALAFLIRLIEFTVRMAFGYLWLTFVLSRFAYSRPWSEKLGGLLIDRATRMAAALVDEIPNLIALGMIVLLTRAIATAAAAWFRLVERGALPLSWMDPLAARAARRMAVAAIWLFAITVAYPYIPGANSDAFKGVSVFVGLVVSLGSAGVVGQMMGGLFVTFNRALRPGDVVKVGDVAGVVKDLGIVSVTVTTRSQEEVTIPNSVVVSDAIRNYSRVKEGVIMLSTTVSIGYDTPWRQVRALLLLAAARTDGVLREPAPAVFETALSDFYVEYELVAYGSASVTRSMLLSALHQQILDVFNEHGVQIMSPHFEGQPESRQIVERSKWFSEPAAKP